MRRTLSLAAVLLVAAAPGRAAEPIGVITELHLANGQVEVKAAGGADWQPAKPLLTIGAGDQVRAAGGARAVLVLMGTQRSTVVTPANSPFTAAPPVQPGLGERVKAAIGLLQSTPRESARKSLTVRSAGDLSPVVILAPRDTLVMPERVSLEWQGPRTTRYSVRVVSSDARVLWESKNVEAGPLAMPPEVRLPPGRYRWELESREHGIQRAAFDVASSEATGQAREAVAAVDPSRYPPATAALLRAAGLIRERFYADARRELLGALAASPDEPALHLLLAQVYDQTGLESLASVEYDRADSLSASR